MTQTPTIHCNDNATATPDVRTYAHGREDVHSRDFTTTKATVNVIGHMNEREILHKNTDAFVFTAVIRHVKAQVLEGVIIVIISKN